MHGDILTAAYRREVDDNDGYSNPVEVSIQRLWVAEPDPIKVTIGGTFGACAHLDLDHARQLHDALGDAIMLHELMTEY